MIYKTKSMRIRDKLIRMTHKQANLIEYAITTQYGRDVWLCFQQNQFHDYGLKDKSEEFKKRFMDMFKNEIDLHKAYFDKHTHFGICFATERGWQRFIHYRISYFHPHATGERHYSMLTVTKSLRFKKKYADDLWHKCEHDSIVGYLDEWGPKKRY